MMERALSAFIHGAARRLTGRQPRKGRDGKWHYPSLQGATKEAGLTDVRTSINRRQNTVAQYIATRPLLDLCEGVKQREGARVTLRWWDQLSIDWEKAKAKETEIESASYSDSGSDTEGGEVRETEIRASGSSGTEWSGASADEWEWGAMKEAGLTDVRTSINRRQNTVAQYIDTRPILDLCEGAKQRE